MLQETDINYMRRHAKSSTTDFQTTLPAGLQPGDTIRVTYFNTETHETFPEKPNWRDAER